jgi:L-lactate dehydrogenase
MNHRYDSGKLVEFATALLERVGMDKEKAIATADVLVEGDLLGHTTHGLGLLGLYLNEVEKGQMARTGEPKVIADFPAALTWDGMRLPGPWLTLKAIKIAMERAKKMGTCTVLIRRSHHIACLAAFLKRVTDEGMMIILTCSDPAGASVAPHGGTRGVFTPNPLAAAWPTEGDPVMLDVSQSITTVSMTRRLQDEGRKFPGQWAVDNQGQPTNDPAVFSTTPPGALLPIGGVDHGHKGYAYGLLVEALTGGLAGHGRADPKEGWTATIYLQIFDPALYGGTKPFTHQMEWLSEACRTNPPRPGVERVRLPGENGLRRRESQLKQGVELYPSVEPSLRPWAQKFGIAFPEPVKG